jgi:hypothetical protein
MKVFLGVYTCRYKSYCDGEFINRIRTLNPKPSQIFIVDNTLDEGQYTERLKDLMFGCDMPYEVVHINVPLDGKNVKDRGYYPQRVVYESVSLVREKFLKSDADALFILESDVCPIADNCIDLLTEYLDEYAAIGGIYYKGFHKAEWFEEDFEELVKLGVTQQSTLCGCTIFRRDLVERLAFRWEIAKDGSEAYFPDACYSKDICGLQLKGEDFKRAVYTKVKCKHIHDSHNLRGWQELGKDLKEK